MRSSSLIMLLVITLFSLGRVEAQSYVPEWKDPKMKIAPSAHIKAYAFNLEEVRLLPGPFSAAADTAARVLLNINMDKLLSDFRVHAGLVPKASKYGGWESSGLAGHTLGHYLSACALQYAASGNKEFLDRVNYIIDELDSCQHARKTGYLGAIPKEDSVWAEVSKGNITSKGFDLNGAWSPWYTVHKIMAGLLDAYLYCHNRKALLINERFSDWAGNLLQKLNDEQIQKMLFCEYGGMSETLINTYALTGNKKYLDLSYKFYDKRILDSLAIGKDILPGKHSNTQIPKIIAGIRRYQLNKDAKDAAIASFFWATVVKDHTYATGGNSNYEYFGAPGRLNETLTDNTTETCNTYNMLKLTRQIFALQPRASLMDYYEKALYNHILASQNHATGEVCYFVPLRMGGQKDYSTQSFTCCVGSGMENHVKYGESIYSRGDDGSMYINLFIPSVLNWNEKKFGIRQETNLPSDNKVRYVITTAQTSTIPIRIRKPHWAGKDMILTINGKPQKIVLDSSGYIVAGSTWKNNDRIELILPTNFYQEAMPDNPKRRAIFFGPVLMAGVLGEKEPDPVKGVPVFVTNATDPNIFIKRTSSGSLDFYTQGVAVPSEIKLIPFYQTKEEYYSIYWDVFTREEWAAQQELYEAERKKQQELEKRTVDIMRFGEMQPERDHNFEGENTATREEHGKKWRTAQEGGFLSFVMKVDDNA